MVETRTTSAQAQVLHVLQGLILPDPELCDALSLHLRLNGDAAITDGVVHCGRGGTLRGDTYYNLFNIGKWQDRCALTDVAVQLHGAGRFEVTIWGAMDDGARRLMALQTLTLPQSSKIDIPLSGDDGPNDVLGVLYYEIRSLDAGQITGIDWVTTQAPQRTPHLMLSVTTFQREAAVARTAARFADFIAGNALSEKIELLIVDNGGTADIAAAAGVQVVHNENLGGAGGFARGLLEARARGASHCLFMDDDAAIHMQSLQRTWAFLAYAKDPKTAVIGAISSARDRGVLWENGATFDRLCRPCFNGVDLRGFSSVLKMEQETTLPLPDQHYGGWWYFAFPVDHAPHMPFPFFVRGDDISFSLVNRFNAITLPGVMCFQDLDFSERESPLTLYLDLRSHLAHHLALPDLALGRWRTAWIATWFFARSLCGCHYETLAALNLALIDTLEGPDFFASHADMATRRRDIAALRKDEVWRDLAPDVPLPDMDEGMGFVESNAGMHRVLKYTLNGHLVPFFGSWGRRVVLRASQRGSLSKVWGAADITYVDSRKRQTYTVRHSKRAMLREGWQMTRSIVRLIWRYDGLRAQWQQGYHALTTGDFWAKRLDVDASEKPKPPVG